MSQAATAWVRSKCAKAHCTTGKEGDRRKGMDVQETIGYCLESAVKIGQEAYGRTLDFSKRSILDVNDILDGYHERYTHSEEDGGLIRDHVNTYASIFGIYVGEVLLREYGASYIWKETEYGIALVKNEGNIINPVAKAGKQIVNGKEAGDNIKSFFDVAAMIMQGKLKREQIPTNGNG